MSWHTGRLGDVLTLKRGHDLPDVQRQDGDVPVVSSSGITGRHSEAKAKAPGVVTGRYGTLGEVFYVEEDYWPLNTALYVMDFKGNHPRFIAYFLQNVLRYYQSDKAAVPGVNRNVLHELKVRYPDTSSQSRIAEILSAYDDLIENNRRRMALLEEATRQLYREWFARLRFPGHEHTRITNGVPEGWRKASLGEITIKIGSGFTPRGGESSYVPEGTPLIRSLNVYDDRFEDDGLAFVSENHAAALAGVTVESKDILLNITGASVARCCMAPERYLPARVNQHVMIIRVDPEKADPFFVHKAVNSDERKRQLLSYAQKGSTREALTKEMIAGFEITLPPETFMRQFGEIAAPSFRQRELLAFQNQKLRAARDLLLPRLPNASFIGFTGTPLFKHDELTRRIFGDYVSRYDFKRSEEDQSTVKLVYENRGEKLGIARLDLNDRIAEAVERAELDPDQTVLLEHLLGKDYEVITADDRLDKLADDFVEHCSTRWQSGKSMFVCIDKVTCARMFQRIEPRWQAKLARVKASIFANEAELAVTTDRDVRERLSKNLEFLRGQAQWMESTIIEIIISEAQNEVRDFQRWGFDIIPHRVVMKTGFQTPDGQRLGVEDAFKDPQHPFRIAIVCAMWLTGFDVECLATLYIDKPMKAHTLMQAIARANRVFPGKDCGVIVDYNGMLKSLREALAQYALGDEDECGEGGGIVAPIEELVAALLQAIEAAEKHLLGLGFDPNRLRGAAGFARIEALRDAVDALYTSDEAKRRFEIMARQVFIRFKTLLMEPSAFTYAERHDNIEAIYKKLQERRDTADVTEVLKELHRIVNEAIRAQAPGDDHAEGLSVNLSQIDFAKLRDEFASKVQRKHAALQDIRDVVEKKLAQMLARNPMRMDFYKRYQEIIADYNREKDRVTVEETFAKLVALANSLDAEQRRAVEEGLGDDELALFDLLFKESISKADRERLKQASRKLLASLRELLQQMPDWTQNTSTQAEVKIHILDHLWQTLPRPPYTEQETEQVAARVYDYVFQRSESGSDPLAA